MPGGPISRVRVVVVDHDGLDVDPRAAAEIRRHLEVHDVARVVLDDVEDAGAAAIVMYSLFEEQIAHEIAEIDFYLSYGTESFAESLTYFPGTTDYNLGPDDYIELIRRAKEALDIPVIASLNGITVGGWMKYASKMEQAGADRVRVTPISETAEIGMARRIQEGDLLAGFHIHLISSDMLGNAARFAAHHIGAAQRVKQ